MKLYINCLFYVVDQWQHLTNTFEAKIEEDDFPIHFYELCDPYCDINTPLQMFYVSGFPL